jgi:lysophospholipase L1-like esterase
MITTTIVTVVGLEASLRAVGAHWLSAVSAARHDLGELTEDPRWQHTARYGLRLAIDSDASNVWQYGDIVRMGFLPPAVAEGQVHRFRFHTDREGFRNPAVRDRIDVAALGDSFTDALTMAVDAGWPHQLEQRTGARVQNYGTAGFGPQQEMRVLEDFALPHHPKTAVLAFFAGNDIRDAEVFELTGRTDAPLDHPAIGWPVKPIVSRADTWYLMNVAQAAATTIGLWRTEAVGAVTAHAAEPPAAGPSFDRGMFTVPVNGRALKVAFMPPYLNMLTFSAPDLAGRRGWALIQDSIAEMDRTSRTAGTRLVVMFLPFKSQVYLPLLTRLFSKNDLNAALHVALQPMHSDANLDRLLANRLALNGMMRDFCTRAGIAFLDTTSALEKRLEAGDNVYFPDDSHMNETGEAVVAETLATFLRSF